MSVEDLEDVLAIERASFPAPWGRRIFLQEIENRNGRALVFRLHKNLVGYLCYWMVIDEAHIHTIAVHPDYRTRGLGKSIMRYLDSECLKSGLKKILLEVARRNLTARNLYKRCGFQSIGMRRHYYQSVKDDALVMEKILESRPACAPASAGRGIP
jgi:ribosomal-protein-alanine N-acetyltransferase